jgi:hypothetical protein
LALLGICAACQVQSVSTPALQTIQAKLDRSGLKPEQENSELHITWALPAGWEAFPARNNLLYEHRQWRAPDRCAGFGVAYIHTPVPFSPKTVIWFAKNQYSSRNSNSHSGRVLKQWSDDAGREWFEAENDTYHVKGFAMSRGCSAWIVYSGYRVRMKPDPSEIAEADSAAASVAPAEQ